LAVALAASEVMLRGLGSVCVLQVDERDQRVGVQLAGEEAGIGAVGDDEQLRFHRVLSGCIATMVGQRRRTTLMSISRRARSGLPTLDGRVSSQLRS
jgi:hypothetical protein